MSSPADLPDLALHSRQRLQAIGLMVIAVFFFAALDAAAKYLVTYEGMSVVQVAWSRFFGQFVLLLVLIPAFGILSARALFTTTNLGLQLLRSVLMVATTGFNFMAVEHLRLDQTVTIIFLAPLVVALLAGPLLGEWIGRKRFMAILVGFAGVLVAVRPGLSHVHPAVLYSFAAMIAYALFMLLTRYMAGVDQPLVTLFYSMIVGAFVGAPFAATHWTEPSSALAWGVLGITGILGGIGHWLFLHAYRLAPASAVAPFLYMQIVSMIAFGFFIFGDLPDVWTLAGASLIIASGVYLVNRERHGRES